MKLSRTQLIAFYSGKPEVEGKYLVKTDGATLIASWIKYTYGDYGWKCRDSLDILEEDVLEWTPLP